MPWGLNASGQYLLVNALDTLEFTLTLDDGPHTVTSANVSVHGHLLFDSGPLAVGASFNCTFSEAGLYIVFDAFNYPGLSINIEVNDPFPTHTTTPSLATTPTRTGLLGVHVQWGEGFSGMIVYLNAGDTLIWTLSSSTTQSITSLNTTTGGGFVFNSGALAPGSSFSYTFNHTGTYIYFSTYNPTITGTVVVSPGITTTSQPTTTIPPTTIAPTSATASTTTSLEYIGGPCATHADCALIDGYCDSTYRESEYYID